MSSPPSLAAAQTVPVDGNVDANVGQHLDLVQEAAAQGVSLLVFPELSLTGYEIERAASLAFALDDARLRPLADAAREHAMQLVVGAPLRLGGALHIAALILQPSGEVKAYTKRHLGAFRPEDLPGARVPPAESTAFAPGDLDPLFTWEGHTVATSICADSRYEAHPQAAAARGADVYLSCQFAIDAHIAFKQSRVKRAAQAHGFVVVFANFGGPTGGLQAAGGSCIRDERGEAVARLQGTGAGLAIATPQDGAWTGRGLRMPLAHG